jgi:hypothetical protein
VDLAASYIEMTSWISTSPKKKVAPAPTTLFSYNEGTFSERLANLTIVTAIYDSIPSNLSSLRDLSQNLLVFTDSKLADRIASYRNGFENRTQVVVLERRDWVSVKRIIPAFWSQQVKQDPEIRLGRTVEDLQFMFERKDFMVKAVEMNPFQTTDFVWVDHAEMSSLVPIRFTGKKIPVDRILVANPEPFTADDLASSFFRGKQRVENGMLIGSKKTWIEFAKLYDTVMSQKLKTSGFIGDNHLMLQYMIIHKPNQFCLVKEPSLVTYFA